MKNKLFWQCCGHNFSLMREWNIIICYENLSARRRVLKSNLMQN